MFFKTNLVPELKISNKFFNNLNVICSEMFQFLKSIFDEPCISL